MVAVNRFPTDTDAEIALVIEKCRELGVNVRLSNVWAEGGKGGIELAEEVIRPSVKECAMNGRAKSTKMRWAIRAQF